MEDNHREAKGDDQLGQEYEVCPFERGAGPKQLERDYCAAIVRENLSGMP